VRRAPVEPVRRLAHSCHSPHLLLRSVSGPILLRKKVRACVRQNSAHCSSAHPTLGMSGASSRLSSVSVLSSLDSAAGSAAAGALRRTACSSESVCTAAQAVSGSCRCCSLQNVQRQHISNMPRGHEPPLRSHLSNEAQLGRDCGSARCVAT
jgi:hypothetical protein